MKRLDLKVTGIRENQESDDVATYGSLARTALANRPEQGFDVATMRSRIAIDEKLEKAGDYVLLEDAEAAELKRAVKAMRWALAHRDIVAFADAVENMPEAQVAEVDRGKAKKAKS